MITTDTTQQTIPTGARVIYEGRLHEVICGTDDPTSLHPGERLSLRDAGGSTIATDAAACTPVDVSINAGSQPQTLYALRLHTDAARAWVVQWVEVEPHMWTDKDTVMVEHRYVPPILNHMTHDGLAVALVRGEGAVLWEEEEG